MVSPTPPDRRTRLEMRNLTLRTQRLSLLANLAQKRKKPRPNHLERRGLFNSLPRCSLAVDFPWPLLVITIGLADPA